jgi:hypothetical protein
MNETNDSALVLVELIKRRASQYLDLLTADTEDDFEAAFNAILEKAVYHLEKNKKNLEKLDEEGLSCVIAGALMIPGLDVTQETNSNGHVDLTIEAVYCIPIRRRLAEAKIYNGPQYHFQGLTQLLKRYTTGREGSGLILVYFRKKDIASLVRKLRDVMDTELPLQQKGATSEHVLKWSFLSTHTHSCGDDIQVGHIGCNLCIEPS